MLYEHLSCPHDGKTSTGLFQNFFSNIPNLQQLSLYMCDWKNVNRLIIDIPTLESIDVGIRATRNPNCQLIVIAPKLASLKCDTDFSIDFQLSNHSLPLNVLLKSNFFGGDLPLAFLHSIKEATSLHIGWFIQINLWFTRNSIAVEYLPLFTKLKHLEISAYNHSIIGIARFERIFMFLHKMPFIESFTITVPDIRMSWNRVDSYNGGVPSCVVNQIKNITITTNEPDTCSLDAPERYFSPVLYLIKYLLNHSLILETLEITCLVSSSRRRPDVLDDIERHPRYSELKSFSCLPCITPKHQPMPFPWEDEDPEDSWII